MKTKITAKRILRDYGTLLALLAIIVVFSILRPYSFFTISNFINITRQISLLVIISIGATLVMSVGEFDLSIGSMASLGGVIAATLSVRGLPLAICFIVPLVISFLIGLFNGWIVNHFKVLSFITTLGMSTILSGVIYWITGGATVFENIPKGFTWLGTKKFGEIPFLSIIMVLVVLVFWFLMRHVTIGRKMYAIGGSEEAAKISGIRVNKYKNLAFGLCGICAAATGMLIASRIGSANATAGDGYFLQAYAAVYIGCTVSKEGTPNMIGTFVGAAILGILANGLTIMQVPSYLQNILTGAVIILSVIAQKLGRGDARS